MNKDYWWGWLDEDGNKVALFFGDPDRYDFEQAERIHDPSEIPTDMLLEYLQ